MTEEQARLAIDRSYAAAIRDSLSAVYDRGWEDQLRVITGWITVMRHEQEGIRKWHEQQRIEY